MSSAPAAGAAGGPGAAHLAGPKRKMDEGDVEPQEPSPFQGLQKNMVMREAKIFSDSNLNPAKCSRVLTRVLYLLAQGEVFSPEESTELFFAVTKLFQSQDVHLRRMIYVVLKELKVGPDESLIVVSCLSKDMTSKTDLFRANAIRVLARIMEPSMLAQMERFLKQAVVDKNPFIVSSTLVAGAHLFKTGGDVIKRWVTEVQEALNSRSRMVQYHALLLLQRIKANDKLAISKVISALIKSPPKGPMAQVLQIRMVLSVALPFVPGSAVHMELLKYLTDTLHNTNSMVMFEAARAICRLEGISALQVAPAIVVLQEFLSSPIPVQRFAAVRALGDIVTRFPYVVAPCRADLEHLMQDSNRTIATLAITCLLKTGQEGNVDRLMKSISGFMGDINDDFKVVLVDSVKTLCLKFPAKFPAMLQFLSNGLREEGGFKYKKAIVDAMLSIVAEVKEARETGMEQFCEYIEDCEFPELSIKIIAMIGDEGPNGSVPSKFLRYCYNRTILETAAVRAAAVTAMAKFGAAVPALTDSVLVLLQRCLSDNDDEVRDRAVYFSNVLKQGRQQAKALLFNKLPVSLATMELSLQTYLDAPIKEPFDLKKHLKISPEDLAEKKADAKAADHKSGAPGKADVKSPAGAAGAGAAAAAAAAPKPDPNLELLNSIPELKALGERFKASAPVEITESDTDYVVTCVKHIFPAHVVFQFNVTNNMDGHVLENVQVEMESEKDDWSEEFVIPEEAKIPHTGKGVTFVCFNRPPKSYASGAITCNLKFHSREVDAATGEASGRASEDDYQLEEIEVNESDFMRADAAQGAGAGLQEFRRTWEGLGDAMELVKKFQFPVESLAAAVKAVMDLLGMAAVDNSHVVPDEKNSHAVNLAGTFYPDVPVLVRAGFMLDPNNKGVTLKVAVRCKDQSVRQMLLSVIR